ncbi:MAG: glycosyltransferase family 2 protein [Desulfobacterales bacterium]
MISVVVPVYNEATNIHEVHRRCTQAMQAVGAYELVFVNDGSRDHTLEMLREIAARDPRVLVISFSRNFGHQIAVTAGLDHARGDAVVVIDGDLQDPPELIPDMVAKWKEGYQVVYARRRRRKGEGLFKKITAFAFYRVMRAMTATDIPVDAGDFRLIDRAVVDVLKNMRERSRFIRGMVSWAGFRQVGIEFERDPRHSGETKYPLPKMIRFALNGIFSFSDKPLKIASYIGLISSLVGMLMILWGLYSKLFHPETTITGWASVFVAVLFIGGIQLFTIGIIGEYISRIYDESKARPLYVVGETIRNEPPGPDA